MRINEPKTTLWRTKQSFMRHKINCGYSASHKLNDWLLGTTVHSTGCYGMSDLKIQSSHIGGGMELIYFFYKKSPDPRAI